MGIAVTALAVVLFAACAAAPPPAAAPTGADGAFATGIVFRDGNENGTRDPGEAGIAHVAVSNGREVVRSDARGRYRLPVGDDTILFVVKPSGFSTPRSDTGLARFYYIHKPAGSPTDLAYPGVAPTGPLPDSVDFPLVPEDQPDAFRMVLLGDTQPYTIEEIDLLARDVLAELVGVDAAFGIVLGDLVGDDLALFDPLNRALGRVGIPWYNVLGNHDMNYRAVDDAHSDETYERIYGPSTYAFEYGRVAFVVLDDVIYGGHLEEGRSDRNYTGGLTGDQLDFLRAYLALVPRDNLVVLAMHIPPTQPPPPGRTDREALYEILASHPHVLALSAHTHCQAHEFIGADRGYPGEQPLHHLNHATAAGSWWRGFRDEVGIPHATMRCGAPNGSSILSFDGNRYAVRFKAARRPADYQMNVFVPDVVASEAAAETEVLVNVFAGSERSVVEMRLGEGSAWQRLEHTVRKDPFYLALLEREAAADPPPERPLLPAVKSSHLWVATLPADPPRGTLLLTVRTTDMFGQTDVAHRLIRVD